MTTLWCWRNWGVSGRFQFNCYYHIKKKKSEIHLFILVHRAGTKYSVNVFGMFDGGESMPLAGEEKTTLVADEPDPFPYLPSGKVV